MVHWLGDEGVQIKKPSVVEYGNFLQLRIMQLLCVEQQGIKSLQELLCTLSSREMSTTVYSTFSHQCITELANEENTSIMGGYFGKSYICPAFETAGQKYCSLIFSAILIPLPLMGLHF